MEIQVKENILGKNDRLAEEVHQILSRQRVYVLNLLGSPGAGKTSLLEETIKLLQPEINMAVIEGDLFTSKDAERIARYQVPVIQINTGGGCHLDANMVKEALEELDLEHVELLIIENVGNLVCPAEFNIGEDAKATVLSITEGEDKPRKYPLIFKQSSIVLLNKIDLLPYTPFKLAEAEEDLYSIHPSITLVKTSCTTKQGLTEWCEWLKQQVRNKRQA